MKYLKAETSIWYSKDILHTVIHQKTYLLFIGHPHQGHHHSTTTFTAYITAKCNHIRYVFYNAKVSQPNQIDGLAHMHAYQRVTRHSSKKEKIRERKEKKRKERNKNEEKRKTMAFYHAYARPIIAAQIRYTPNNINFLTRGMHECCGNGYNKAWSKERMW